MSALSRIRTLAAALALLLFMSANAIAWTDKPMDTPGGPPVPNPQEVGDPDTGHNLTWKRYFEYFRVSLIWNPLLRLNPGPVRVLRLTRIPPLPRTYRD